MRVTRLAACCWLARARRRDDPHSQPGSTISASWSRGHRHAEHLRPVCSGTLALQFGEHIGKRTPRLVSQRLEVLDILLLLQLVAEGLLCDVIHQPYICRNQLSFTTSEFAAGNPPRSIARRSLYTTYRNDSGANSQLKRALSVPSRCAVLYW